MSNKFFKKLSIASAAALFSVMMISSCENNKVSTDDILISKENIEVVNGQFTPEIMHKLGKVSDPQVSPSGEKILYGVSYTSIELNKGQRHLYVMNADGSNNQLVSNMPVSMANARWYKDDSTIAFVMKGQVYLMSLNAKSAPKQLSNVEAGVQGFEFSPDFSKMMFVSEVPYAVKPKDVYPDLEKSSGRIITDLMYRHWDCFVENIPHTFFADVNAELTANSVKKCEMGTAVDILGADSKFELPTLPFGGLEQLSWSPDGKYIAYSCRKVTGKEYAFSTNTDIYLYNIETGKAENLTEGMMGYDTDPVFSPKGDKLAWISMERAGFEADKQRLFVIDMSTKEKSELTTEYKYNATSPTWKADGSALYFASLVNALEGVFEVDLNKNIRRITADNLWNDFSGVQLCGDKLITTYTSMDQPSEIVSISAKDGAVQQITFENKETLDKLAKCTYEQRWIKTTDNKLMHTWVVYPPQFDPKKVYPSILFCTGGPQGTLSQSWSTRWNFKLMASQGYIVVLPNRRGTTAFGQEWCDQISGDYIGQNMKDYLAAAKELQKEPYVGKMGASGASYGGFSIYYLAGIHKNTFDAFLAHAGIFNQEQMYMMTEELWFPKWDNGGAPWDNNPVAKRHYSNSAHKLIKNWDTPIMVTHGEMDYRVPVEQGMAAFNAAQMMGVPSEMLLFPEENHWILKPQNAVHWQRAYFAWFDKWLKK